MRVGEVFVRVVDRIDKNRGSVHIVDVLPEVPKCATFRASFYSRTRVPPGDYKLSNVYIEARLVRGKDGNGWRRFFQIFLLPNSHIEPI